MRPVTPRPALLSLLCGCLLVTGARAQFVAQRHPLTETERAELAAGRDRLAKMLSDLEEQSRRTGTPRADRIPDARIYLDAVDRNLRQDLFFTPQNVAQARECLREGERRAGSLQKGEAPWEQRTGVVAFGYRSRVDGSAQPYQVYVPEGYSFERPAPQRLDIFLHGRAGTLNEIAYLSSPGWVRANWGADRLSHLALYPYGRANNGWRFAGEQDLFEALEAVRTRFRVDNDRVLLRGFSMGGHGTWHIGLQHPGRWAAMSPGAGFTDTKVYQNLTEPLPAWQESLLHLYDPVDYVANAWNLPVLAYIGDMDPAIGQHRLITEALKKEGAPFREFIGPNTGHRYEPAVLQQVLSELGRHRRNPGAMPIHFVTYTLRFPDCRWVHLEGLERHWERAEVQARAAGSGRLEVTTRNVSALRLAPPAALVPPAEMLKLRIDGREVTVGKARDELTFALVKRGGRWTAGEPEGLRKKPGLQGPIDDALFGPLVAVTPTGTPWSPPLDRWVGQEVQRFRDGWDGYFRATLPQRTDGTLTAEDIREKHLYLFGDPGSNAVLARLLPKLPLRWTREKITLAGRSFSTADHVPMLVFPNPENPERYVVINTGFTFSRADWEGSNARQYPHLPDYAVVRFDSEKFSDDRRKDAVLAGFFDERWRVSERYHASSSRFPNSRYVTISPRPFTWIGSRSSKR